MLSRNISDPATQSPILRPTQRAFAQIIFALTLAILASAGCLMNCLAQDSTAANTNTATTNDVLAADLNPSVDPAKDFFDFANGGWLARNPIPASEAGWGIGNLVEEDLYAKLRRVNEEAALAHAPVGSDQQKIGDFWTTAMDQAKASTLGLKPLQPSLDLIDSIQNLNDVINVSFALRPVGIDPFCDIDVSQDEKQSDLMSVHVSQGGLGLPDRDFYFNREKGVAHIRKEYVAHLTRMLVLMGHSEREARRTAKNIMKFETALAKVSRKLEDLRDPEANYHKMSPHKLTETCTPLINWDHHLAGMSLHPDFVIVGQPEFFSGLNQLLTQTPIPVLKDYLRLELISSYAEYLSPAWDDEDFSFAKVLSGQQEERPRWKRVLDSQDHAMGMILGRIFVQEYFPGPTKQRYVNLVEAIRSAYRDRIHRLNWMSDETKGKALDKLAKMKAKVGYPDHWKDYSTLVIGTNSYCENMMNAARWHYHDMISKFGQPVDRTEWDMNPQTYNAYYDDANNEIVLPAAIFTVPGKTDDQLDDALVYGYAAAGTIGHEITHGFDDEGRKFDANGNLTDWWTPADAERFQKQAAVMVTQFNGYEPLPGLHINGDVSLGENLADYGGLLLGLDAFKKTEQYREGKSIAGFTPLQRYFLGYALGWLYHERDENLRKQLLSDVHSPAKWRVNGPLSNLPDFYTAFGVKPNDPMWRSPQDRVNVW